METNNSMDIKTETFCRTCANTCTRRYGINSKICNFSTTIKGMIVLLIPQMENALDDNDVICNICRKTLIQCVRFIDKCLHVEADRKENVLCQKSSLVIAPITNLEDVVKEKEVDSLIDVDQKDTNGSRLNGDFDNNEETDQVVDIRMENNNIISDNILQNYFDNDEETDQVVDIRIVNNNGTNDNIFKNDFGNDEETDQVVDIGIENNKDISDNILQNDPVSELPNNVFEHNRIISAKEICPNKGNEFFRILASNGVKTIQFSQDLERTTEHKRVILIGTTFKCSKCYTYFEYRGIYTKHLKWHERFDQIKEQQIISRKRRLEEKEARKLGIQMNGYNRKHPKKYRVDLECKTCLEIFPSIEELELHSKIHPRFVCEKCGKGFAKKTQIYAHRAVHNEKISYVCEICGRALKTKGQLNQHSLTHKNTVYSCKKCPKVFSTVIRLRAHLRNTHGEGRGGIWPCKECGKIFKRSSHHQQHYREIHLGNGPKICDICGQGFHRSDYLLRHKRRHIIFGETRESLDNEAAKSQTNGVLNSIEKVERSFRRLPRGTLKEPKRRIRRNTLPPGPYLCHICMKTYKVIGRLQRHILVHGTSTYRCKFCGKIFKLKYQLASHEKLHERSDSSEKYSCGNWNSFQTQDNLDLQLCEDFFSREYSLNDMANVHLEDHEAEEEMRSLMMTGLGTTLYNSINNK